MPGNKCCVENCLNNSATGLKLSFHRFPKNVALRQVWIIFCDKGHHWEPNQNSRLCSDHFIDKDFEINPCDGRRMRLLKNVIPTRKPWEVSNIAGNHLSTITDNMLMNSEYSQEAPSAPNIPKVVESRWELNKIKQTSEEQAPLSTNIGDMLKKSDYSQEVHLATSSAEIKLKWDLNKINQAPEEQEHFSTNIDDMLTESVDSQEGSRTISPSEVSKLKLELDRIKHKSEEQEELIDILIEVNNKLQNKLSEQRFRNKHLEIITEDLKKKLPGCILQNELNNKIKELLSETLSGAQLDVIMKLEKKVKWSKDDIFKAITLRYFSKRAYSFLRKRNFPLPNSRTLRVYCGKINLISGLLYDILKLMSIGAENMSKRDRAAVLSYGQMKVSSIYEYNKEKDEVVGPYNHVQVVMARGLFGNWKQPIYIGFDCDMNEDLLMEIIIALHRASFDVVAVVGDCGVSNQGIMRDLGINMKNVFFQNPLTEKKIFCFPDSSHLLKSIRNWFLRSGFLLSNRVAITKHLLDDIIHRGDEAENGSLFKLTEQHLKCAGNSDQENIYLSRQLLSHETATAVRSCNNSEEIESLANFIQLISDWFEIMKSSNMNEVSYYKKPYEGAEKQNERLKEMYETIKALRPLDRDKLQVFQKNILISIHSLQGLFMEMEEIFNIDFICTSKLNLDAVESLFGYLRTQGGFDEQPRPINVIKRLRMILLGKVPGIINSLYEDGEEILVRNILKKAEVVPLLPEHKEDDDGDFDLETSAQSSSSASTSKQIEEDGIDNLSGQLAKKFCRSFPELGADMILLEEHTYSKYSCVNGVSIKPSLKLKRAIQILESNFTKINKGKFAVKKRILDKLFNVLKNKVDIPEVITKAFIQQRILLRMKRLNNKKLMAKNKRIKGFC